MYTLIRERVASMYELTYVYNLDEMLKLEVLLASAVHLLDCWEDISAETGEEPENYGEQRAILQAEYDAIKC